MTPGGLDLAIKAFLRVRPFRPFLTEVVSGDRILIDHPEMFTLGGDIVLVKSALPEIGTRILGLDQIKQLLYPPKTAAS